MVQKYRKKPVVIEAYQTDTELDIQTLEGIMHANKGDYIITGVHGEIYPCKPDIFEETYELAEKNNFRVDILIKNLRNFAKEHGGILPMNMEHKIPNYQIACKSDGTLYADTYIMNKNFFGHFGEIWFVSKEAAEQAIKTFYDELIWYFTEYNPMSEE